MDDLWAAMNALGGLVFAAWALGTFLWRAGRRGPLVSAWVRVLRWPALGGAVLMVVALTALGGQPWVPVVIGLVMTWYWASDWDTGTRRGVKR